MLKKPLYTRVVCDETPWHMKSALSLLCSPSQISASPFSGKYLISPPPLPWLFQSLINDRQKVLINQDCKALCGLIRYSLFTNRKFGFDSDPAA